MLRRVLELANLTGATDKDTDHSYLEVYELLLARRRDAQRVLEIGVLGGGSLLLWRAYFPAARIVGVDCRPCVSKVDRISVITGDAYAQPMVDALRKHGPFDVIIDDGSHRLDDMAYVAREYTQLLAPGGLLVLEDVQDPEWVPRLVDAFPAELRPRVHVIDRRHVKGRYDDLLVVLDTA